MRRRDERQMRCEGSCGRSFHNGERVYATPTRVVVVRNGKEQITDVEAYYCANCNVAPEGTALFTAGVARVR